MLAFNVVIFSNLKIIDCEKNIRFPLPPDNLKCKSLIAAPVSSDKYSAPCVSSASLIKPEKTISYTLFLHQFRDHLL